MNKKNILIVGAGKIGVSIAKLLGAQGNTNGCDYSDMHVCLVDSNEDAVQRVKNNDMTHLNIFNIQAKVTVEFGEMNSVEDIEKILRKGEFGTVLSACPYTANVNIATACLNTGSSYFDLTEDRYTTEAIKELSKNAKPGQIFMPQCGLAPGFIGILANSVHSKLDSVDTLKMRVGALPQYPSNMMKYNLTWSTEGLINEYSNPCEAIVNGKVTDTIPLEEVETFSLEGVEYEAFNTSGGLGTLCDTLSGKVNNMNYKTLRYPGHAYLMRFLLKELGLGERGPRRDMIRKLFDETVPTTPEDVVIAYASATGMKNGRLTEITDLYVVPSRKILNEIWTGIQLTTASGACVALDMHINGMLPTTGFVKQEDISLEDLLESRFGHFYKNGKVTEFI